MFLIDRAMPSEPRLFHRLISMLDAVLDRRLLRHDARQHRTRDLGIFFSNPFEVRHDAA
jgi:hypothetical protein